MVNASDWDPWVVGVGPPGRPKGHNNSTDRLIVAEIGPITPLDQQFGLALKKTVPDDLHEPLFGLGGDLAHLGTYAILDAAKIANLQVRLEMAGLEHACLFKGKALSDLGNQGPWIVSLRDDNSFTRALLTASGNADLPGSLWNKEPGIYIRSALPMDALLHHFRKFTRIPDDTGKWYLFRFWEASYLVDFLRSSPASGVDQFFKNGQITAVYTIADQMMVRLSLAPDIRPAAKTRISVTPAMLAAFGVTAEQTFRRRLYQDVQRHGALTKQKFAVIYHQVSAAGFTTRGAVRRLVTWMVLRFPRHDRPDWLTRSLAASKHMPEDMRVARLLNDDPERDSHAG